MAEATQCELVGEWRQAVELFQRILAMQPGDQETEGHLKRAQEESTLQTAYSQARDHEVGGRYPAALREYDLILTIRPSGYGDTTERCEYCRARVLETHGKWDEAREAYAGVTAKQYPDIPQRLQYAQARSAEETERWADAVSLYESLPPDHRDVEQRLAYARGRHLEANDEWASALSAWKPLPDSYLDLGQRRAQASERIYQSGREAEKQGKWAEAVRQYASLPESYKDVRDRLKYVNGRAAEREQQWAVAAACYEAAPNFEDVSRRLPYAEGRAAEAAEEWEKARSAYQCLQSLDPYYEDVKKRFAYCRGREAENRGDWRGVFGESGFGDLSDNDYDGDVGRRRHYARARHAEAEENWAKVVEELKDLNDQYRDVAQRRVYGSGRLAAQQDDWPRVVREFTKLSDDFADGAVQKWRCYAQGRQSEAADKWEKALEDFAGVIGDFPDARQRHAYAAARVAEGREKWPETLAALHDLPEEYLDVARRRTYARGRIAVQDGDWHRGVQAFQSVPGFLDAAEFLLYSKGRAEGEASDWAAARDTFSHLPAQWRDARCWQSYADGRADEKLGWLKSALEVYQSLPNNFHDVVRRRERLHGLLKAASWLDELARAHLVADPAVHQRGNHPYDSLLPAGVTPDSPQTEVKNASFVLMEMGLMTPEGRVAWDQLRGVPERLKVDALTYRTRNLEGIRDLIQKIEPAAEPELVQHLCQSAPQDAPLILLLAGRHDEALAEWERQQVEKPNDLSVAQALAVAQLCRAQQLEAGGAYEQADCAWARAIANWAAVLTDDAYWLSWREDRAARYQEPVRESDVSRLQSELVEHLFRLLAQYADRYLMEGKKGRASQCQQLALAFEAELEGAKMLKEAGGLPLGDRRHARLCCGLLLIRSLHFESALAKIVSDLGRSLDREAEEATDIVAALEAALEKREGEHPTAATPEMVQRLRCAFSELGPAAVLLDRRQYEEALQALPERHYRHRISQFPGDCDWTQREEHHHLEGCDRCREFADKNPAYLFLPHRSARLFRDASELAVQTYLAMAEAALTSGEKDLQEPLRHWQQAIEISRNAGTQVRTKQAIARVALGRASALEQEAGRERGRRLTEAINLLEAVRSLVGAAADAPLKGKQSELLTDRGVWHGYACHPHEEPDFDKAASDLRRALELNLSSLHARDNLARALVFHAVNLHQSGDRRRVMQLFAEALCILDEGLRRFANHTQLQAVLNMTLQELEEVLLAAQGVEGAMRQLEEAIQRTGPPAEPIVSNIENLRAIAREKLEAGDTTGAALGLIKVIRLRPEDEAARHELLNALQQRAYSE